jgi:lipopolysaccharide biosynthesis glycosyltransferase
LEVEASLNFEDYNNHGETQQSGVLSKFVIERLKCFHFSNGDPDFFPALNLVFMLCGPSGWRQMMMNHQHRRRHQLPIMSSQSSDTFNLSKSIKTKKARKRGNNSAVVLFLVGLLIVYSSLQLTYFNNHPPRTTRSNASNSSTSLVNENLPGSLPKQLKQSLRKKGKLPLITTNETIVIPPRPPPPTSPPLGKHGQRHHRRWAYAFLVAGVDPDRPVTYRNYLNHVLIATYTLRQHHSQAAVVVIVQLSAKTNRTKLFPDVTETDGQHEADYAGGGTTSTFPTLLKELEIELYYAPRPIRDNFYSAQLAKFEILNLIQYTRVLYLDADVLPLCNLDYLFVASDPEDDGNNDLSNQQQEQKLVRPLQLKPNVVLSWFKEPAHGGFFLLQPSRAYYQSIQAIITRRELQALTLPYPHWDPIGGWGHVIRPQDAWHGLPAWPSDDAASVDTKNFAIPIPHATSTNWTFHGDFADQGLLYYYTKYYLQDVSILFLDHVEQWGSQSPATEMPVLESVDQIHTTLDNNDKPSSLHYTFRGCLPHQMEHLGHYGSAVHPLLYDHVPHRDFVHFSGDAKPWEQSAPSVSLAALSLNQVQSSMDFWWYQFHHLILAYNLTDQSLPIDRNQRPNLGRYPTHRSMMGTLQKKLKKQKQQQQQQLLQDGSTNQ